MSTRSPATAGRRCWSPRRIGTTSSASFLLDNGADPNIANKGGWTPLYLAVDNRNIEGGDYPVRKGDMDHLDFIKKLLDHGADVNARMKDSTETRTVFTDQWVDEDGATAFLRASQSSDLAVMRLLLAHGADPKIATVGNVTRAAGRGGHRLGEGLDLRMVRSGQRRSREAAAGAGHRSECPGRHRAHGAARRRPQGTDRRHSAARWMHGAKLDTRDYGNRDNRGGRLQTHTWLPVDYADGLVRVGVQSAIAHPETGLLIRKLMTERGLQAPPLGRTLDSICITEACQ